MIKVYILFKNKRKIKNMIFCLFFSYMGILYLLGQTIIFLQKINSFISFSFQNNVCQFFSLIDKDQNVKHNS